MKKGAQFSYDREYRYALWRTWDEAESHVTFIGLNPSTADESEDDPTIRRCIGFAKEWGFGGINMVNLFAVRATSPNDMIRHPCPIGYENNDYLRMYLEEGGLNVACWGNHGEHLFRGEEVIAILGKPNLSIFGLTGKSQPKHPLYLPKNTKLIHQW
jgi:hypothetical protein